ncbi:MAG TPA: sigma-70 family RNA polymerase sigma factor, partial [Kofleriaceae bacterium]
MPAILLRSGPPDDSDFALLDAWRAGDRAAGQELLGRHFATLCGFFESKCKDAEDLVQRTMLACIAAKDAFRKQASFRTYLFTVARRELWHYLRSKQREGKRFDFATISIAEIITTPGSRLARQADRARVIDALRRLPVEQQTLLELHYWQELSIEALSEIFEIDPRATRVRLFRARRRLREALERRSREDQDDEQAREVDDEAEAARLLSGT